MLATGIEFGPDGVLYAADWINGWGTKNKGRIWKLDVKNDKNGEERTAVQSLLAASFDNTSTEALADLLSHADMRVRQKAQFELADRAEAKTFNSVLQNQDAQLARIHSIYGLGQITRNHNRKTADMLLPLLADADPEIRAQAAKQLGDLRYKAATDQLLALLKDDYPRARFFAAEALGRIGAPNATKHIIAMLSANNDEDAYLRHAGSLALARIGDARTIIGLSDHTSPAVRLAAVVALRRMQHAGVGYFLNDADEYIVTEAARAINDDHSIEDALPALAKVLDDPRFTAEPLIRRAINANLRLGTVAHANRVAQYASREDAPAAMRAEALAVLGVWHKPSVMDRVDGRYRGPVERSPEIATTAFEAIAPAVLSASVPEVKIAATATIQRINYTNAGPALRNLLTTDPDASVRVAALQALQQSGATDLTALTQGALADKASAVRMAALALVPDLNLPPANQVSMLASAFEAGNTAEQQFALAAMGKLKSDEANTVLDNLLGALEAGTLNPGIKLDLSNAVTRSGSTDLIRRLQNYQASQPSDDPLVKYAETLEGGNAQRGRRIFYQHAAAQCVRCHNVGDGGGEVGPNLTNIGATRSREELLVSLVDPSAAISNGYGLVTLTFADDTSVTGTLVHEDESFIEIISGDSEPVKMAKSDIKKRVDAPSSMPAMGDILVKRDLRDLVEFLAGLK